MSLKLREIVRRPWDYLSSMFVQDAPVAPLASVGLGQSAELQPAGANPYQLMFCIASLDDGTADNPHLHPVYGEGDVPMEFNSLTDLLQLRHKLSRVSDDLVYYAVRNDSQVPEPGR